MTNDSSDYQPNEELSHADGAKRAVSPQSLGAERTRAGAENVMAAGGTKSLGDESTFAGKIIEGDVSTDDHMEIVDLSARYAIIKSLGKGGMGEVLLATDKRLDRKVAIKRIHGDSVNSRTAVNRFLTEARSIAALNHPNIVQIYDYGRASDGPFLIMEHVDGDSLLDRCRRGAIPLEEAIQLACQLCDGLGRAHAGGIIHRDIKPANILLTQDGLPKLTDFGLAKAEASDSGMTMAGAVLGTLDFMPPEQRRDAALVDSRSDLWSLAATLYQMVTGKSPRIIKFHDVPRGLQKVLGKALEDAKEDRYQTASEFKEALKQSLRDEGPDLSHLEQGQCPKCGTKNDSSRRFCRNPDCGVSLEVACLSCAAKIPVWEAICGGCGAKQEQLAVSRREKNDSDRLLAEQALEANNYALARSIATPLADEQDPRLQQLVGWAKQFLGDVDKQYQQYSQYVSQRLSESQQHEKAYDYAAGIKSLTQVSEAMRDTAVTGHKETVAQVLTRLTSKQEEISSLEKRIGASVKERRFDQLLPEVDKLLRLAPNRADMLKLKDELVARRQKLQQVRNEAFAEAESAFAEQDYLGCLASLEKIDAALEDASIEKLRDNAKHANEELQRLDLHISRSLDAKAYDGLLEIVEQYLALQSEDQERQQLRGQLIAQQEKRTAQLAAILKNAAELRNKAEYDAALAELRRVPQHLRTAELESLENSCAVLSASQNYALRALTQMQGVEADVESLQAKISGYRWMLTSDKSLKDRRFEELYLQTQQMLEQRKQQSLNKQAQRKAISIAASVGLVAFTIIGLVIYVQAQRSATIAELLKRNAYSSVLELEPDNQEALALKKKAADIASALANQDYASVLRLDPINSEALALKKKAADIARALANQDYVSVLRLDPTNSEALALKKAAPLRNSIGMELKLLPHGRFSMGEGEDAHDVTLTQPFYLGVYEVTQEQYARVMGENPSSFKGEQNPVENVSWADAVEFCRQLSALPEEKAAGRVYRLPTEAEWEYACRAGTTTSYSFGNEEAQLGDFAWFRNNSNKTTHPVGQKKPNPWGLYDMHGNVLEWCSDWWGDYPTGNVTDPQGPSQGSFRVSRGGGWSSFAWYCRSAFRDYDAPDGRYYDLGFRVAVDR